MLMNSDLLRFNIKDNIIASIQLDLRGLVVVVAIVKTLAKILEDSNQYQN